MADDEFTFAMSLEISAPIHRVWQMMTDIHSWPRWHPLREAVRGELVEGGTIATKLRSGPELSAQVISVNFDEPHYFSYAAGDPAGVIGRHSWTLTELDPRKNPRRKHGTPIRTRSPEPDPRDQSGHRGPTASSRGRVQKRRRVAPIRLPTWFPAVAAQPLS
jgi:uncharacterized protein YndB with AHSA1/START domain